MKAAPGTLIVEFDAQPLAKLLTTPQIRWVRRRTSSPTSTTVNRTAHSSLIGYDNQEMFTPLPVAEPDHRLDRAHHGAAHLERADPTAQSLQRAGYERHMPASKN
jgi:hypothetical protein